MRIAVKVKRLIQVLKESLGLPSSARSPRRFTASLSKDETAKTVRPTGVPDGPRQRGDGVSREATRKGEDKTGGLHVSRPPHTRTHVSTPFSKSVIISTLQSTRPTPMQPSSLLARFRRPLALLVFTLAALGTIPSAVHAQTAADLTPAALAGKTVTCTIVGGNAPFETSGLFAVQLGAPAAGQYTIAVSNGNTTARTGTYSTTSGPDFINIRLNGYVVNNSTVELELYPIGNATATAQSGAGRTYFEMFGGPANKRGTFTINGVSSGGGGGTTAAPVVTSALTATATVGTPFVYAITTNPAATSYTNAGGNAPIAISPGSGLVTGTFTAAGTFTFSFTATNAGGTSSVTTVTVTVAAAPTGGTIASYAGTYTGGIFQIQNGIAFVLGGATYRTVIAPAGPVTTVITNAGSATTLTGTINANGAITFTGGTGAQIYRITSGNVVSTGGRLVFSTPFTNAGYVLQNSTTFVADPAGGGGTVTPPITPPTAAAAPTNLVGYRNKVGGVFQFTVSGSARGTVWGTDVYTDDSSVAAAAVHAGVHAPDASGNIAGTVTVTILPGQSAYPASARNGVSSASWGSWAGSYSFAGAGAVASSTTATNVATARPAAAPGFVAGTAALAAGGRLVCPVNVSGGGTYSYRWYLNGNLIAGATANPYVVESLTTSNAGTYAADVTNALGTTRISAGTVSVGSAGSPVFALQPISKSVVPGATFTLAANASGTNNTYLWFRNNVALPGETGAILLRNNANAADAGAYTVRVSNPAGTVTSSAATVAISANASRPANISVRTNVATGTLVTPAFVLKGSGTKRMLIRAVGPGLAAFGLPGTMENPKLTVFRSSTELTANDDWSATAIGQAFTATGAFALTPGSKDAALVVDLPASPGGESYSVQVTNATGTGGIVLVEVYDADILKGTSTSLLVNVSVRGQTAPGDDVLTLGLVIGGQGPRTLLVRGIGPKLAAFGVTGTVPDPRLQIVDSQSRIILANDDWASADFVSELALASTYVGAFALDAGSKDAATLSLVDPGAYTIQVSGTAAGPTGEALVEVYEVP